MKRYLAEFIAAFFLVFVGAGAIISDGFLSQIRVTDSFGPLGIAIAHGLALAVAIAAIARISGGHANPAVSLAFFVARRMTFGDFIAYVFAQLLGAVAAAFLLKRLLVAEAVAFTGVGVPGLADGLKDFQGAAIEVILTFFLVFVIWGVAVDKKGPKAIAPFAIGLVLTFDILAGGAFTGAAMNPARWFGPALANMDGFTLNGFKDAFVHWPVWTAGPILGALLASLLYETFFLDEEVEVEVVMAGDDYDDDLDDDLEDAVVVSSSRAASDWRDTPSPLTPPSPAPPAAGPDSPMTPPPPPPPPPPTPPTAQPERPSDSGPGPVGGTSNP